MKRQVLIMKINSVSSIYSVYNTKPAISRKKTTDAASADSYNVSNEGKGYNSIYKAVMQSPDIREDKVNSISQQIADGTYNVSTQDLADKILSGFM
jgi:negative regulator of flagellin synthesis FlgM